MLLLLLLLGLCCPAFGYQYHFLLARSAAALWPLCPMLQAALFFAQCSCAVALLLVNGSRARHWAEVERGGAVVKLGSLAWRGGDGHVGLAALSSLHLSDLMMQWQAVLALHTPG